jgi:hypothetical protein
LRPLVIGPLPPAVHGGVDDRFAVDGEPSLPVDGRGPDLEVADRRAAASHEATLQ